MIRTGLLQRLSWLVMAFGCAAPKAPSSSAPDAEWTRDTVNAPPPSSAERAPSPAATEHPNESSTLTATPQASPIRAMALAPETRAALQLYEAPISHLATGKHRVASITRTAAGSRSVVVHELPKGNAGAKLRASSLLPTALQSESVELQLFMGRDDWPRVILTQSPSNQGQHYYRFRPATGWDSPTDEQGALSKLGRVRGFYGVLGHADPEVLCVPNHECYEKRISGWRKRSVPGPEVWQVVLAASPASTELEAWAWPRQAGATHLLRLVSDRQVEVHWNPKLPAPGGTMRQLFTWNNTYVALTSEGLLGLSGDNATAEASPPPEHVPPEPLPAVTPPSSESRPSWRLLTAVEDGLDAAMGPSSEILVATSQGVFAWRKDETALTPVALALPEKKASLKLGLTRRIAATVGPQTRLLIAGDDGLFLLDD